MPISSTDKAQTIFTSFQRRASGILLAGIGAFLAIGVIVALGRFTDHAWILGSFGASCVLLFGFPDAPFSRMRSAIGGHLSSSLIGLCFLHWFGPGWPAMAAATAVALMVMMTFDIVHPPAGSNPIIIFTSQAQWSFLLFPTLAGIVALVIVARAYRASVRSLGSLKVERERKGSV